MHVSPPQDWFDARFVSVYGDPLVNDGNDFAISQLELHDYDALQSSPTISVGARALGPQPSLIVDGTPPGNGTDWNDSHAVILVKDGAAHALMVDLGAVVNICGNIYDCVNSPLIQADQNDVYQMDYSTDGVNWTEFDQFPAASGNGLQTRNIGCNLRPDPKSPCGSTNHDPNFTARYVRVWAVQGDGKYSVSQLELWNVDGQLVSEKKPTYGPEPLVTNGEYAPEGTSWDDAGYATVLPPCQVISSKHTHRNQTASGSTCVTSSAQSAVASIDLGASLAISQLKLQANSYGVYQVDVSEDRVSWSPLWTVPTDSNGNLRTRVSPLFNAHGRYLRVYGTSYATPGQSLYSVSELEVDTPVARTSCPYDSAADAGENFSCSYAGQFQGDALLLPSTEISGVVDKAQLKVECKLIGLGPTWTETIGDAGTIWCYLDNITGSAHANFCAGSCADAAPIPSTISYAEIDSLQISAPQVSCNASGVPQWLTDIVVPEIKDDLIGAVTPPITDALNDLLQEFIPFPGVCSAETDAVSLNLLLGTHKFPHRHSNQRSTP